MGAVQHLPGHVETARRPRRRVLPWAAVGLWIAILAVVMPFSGKLGDVTRNQPADYLPDSADSTQVTRLLEKLPGGDTTDVILVYGRDSGITGADRTLAQKQAGEMAGDFDLAGGGGVPKVVPSKDGKTLMVPFSIGGIPNEDDQVKAVDEVRETVGGTHGGLTVQVGGPGGMQADSQEVFDSVDGTLMFATAGVVAVLLILTYRSPFLWLVPLLGVGVAAMTSMAVVYGLVQGFDLTVTSMSSSVMTVLIFGAGTDYALLLTARYREELRRIPEPYDAMKRALRRCGPAVLASSGTVAAGLLCLMAADLNSSAGLGPVGAVGVLCALAAMLTLFPALLVLLGRRVFWPLIPAYGSDGTQRRTLFDRLGGSVARRPVAILVGGVVLLGALATGILNMPGSLKQEDAFTNTQEAVTAGHRLEKAYPAQSSQPLTVLAEAGHTDQALAAIRATDGVARVDTGRSGAGWTQLSVFAKDAPETAGETRTIHDLRDRLGDDALVGGPSAQQIDLEKANSDDRMVVIPLTLAAVLLILMLLLRSVVAPLVLTVAVVASWGAALGLGALLFEGVFGFEGTDPGLPLLSFVFSVALGVDYGIFLMHRMREEAIGGMDTRQAALTALRRTGGVIASAGLVLAATFAVLATLPMVMMVEMGFVVAVGVLLDTFLVRTYLVTSASWLLGRTVWWPGRLSRAPSGETPATRTPETVQAG